MKLCHVVSHIDEEASGPSYSVPRLCQAVAEQGHAVTLATLDRGGGTRDLGAVCHAAFAEAAVPRKLGRSSSLRAWLMGAGSEGIQLIHSHGLWMMPNIYPAHAAARADIPHVIAPRGTLDPAALIYSRWLKKAVWYLGQGRAVRAATALHATSEEEAEHIRALDLRQPILLSPNGIDIPDGARPPRGTRRTLLYLGRLHEKKGLDLLLAAWAGLEAAHPEWDLRIVGKGIAAFETQLEREVGVLGLTRVQCGGPLYGADKLEALQGADLFVLPTRGENFAMVVAEALAAGTPVLTTTGAPWSDIPTRRCGWSTDVSAEAIGRTLGQAMTCSSEALEEMGARGRAWMRDAYGWEEIGAQLSEAYNWLCQGGPTPDRVLQD